MFSPLRPPCEILYEEGPCLVINKPPGVLTQAPEGIDSIEVQIKNWIAAKEGSHYPVYLAVIHRLDRPASGATGVPAGSLDRPQRISRAVRLSESAARRHRQGGRAA